MPAPPPRAGLPRRTAFTAALLLLAALPLAAAGPALTDVYTQDVTRFGRLLDSAVAERRVEGVQGLANLKHWPSEELVLELLSDSSLAVQREALLALTRLGTAASVPQFIKMLGSPSWENRQLASLALERLTAQSFGAGQQAKWQQWWNASALTNKEQVLLSQAKGADPEARRKALRALSRLATPASETVLTGMLHQPGLSLDDRNHVAEALERVASDKAVPVLAGFQTDAGAWALGRIGGAAAEQALLAFPKTLVVMINLDRLHSTNAGPFIPHLVANMGLATYRGQPDDLMNVEAQPIQRVGANLIRRSPLASEFINQVLLELEYTMKQPPGAPRPPIPAPWKNMIEAMRSELKPGFVREDGTTTSQPLTALELVVSDPALAPRLQPLLRHPAFVPRVYVAMTLGRLEARTALPDILGLIKEGYPFSDPVALASGKHFDQSQTVRWRGFLCMALGRLGGEDARAALEQLAGDKQQPRDIRYGAVVGLRFIGSPASLPLLHRVAASDIIWMIRDEARRAAADIETVARESQEKRT